MFKDTDYKDGNLQFIEVSDNQDNRIGEVMSTKIEDDANTVVQINVIENRTGKVIQNYDVPLNIDGSESKNSIDLTGNYDYRKETETNRLLELRMQNLINQVVLNIPEVCAICLDTFDTYVDVLKHKIETHLGSNQDFFFCPICHEKFFSNKNLVEHLNDHSDVYSFICILCSGNFYTEKTLRYDLGKLKYLFNYLEKLFEKAGTITETKLNIRFVFILNFLPPTIFRKRLENVEKASKRFVGLFKVFKNFCANRRWKKTELNKRPCDKVEKYLVKLCIN